MSNAEIHIPAAFIFSVLLVFPSVLIAAFLGFAASLGFGRRRDGLLANGLDRLGQDFRQSISDGLRLSRGHGNGGQLDRHYKHVILGGSRI